MILMARLMQSQYAAVAVSALFLLWGIGMIYVTWISPASRLRPLLMARWKLFGRSASKWGAAGQAATLLMLGVVSLLTVAESPLIKAGLIMLGVMVLLTGMARLADLTDDDI